MKNNTFIAIAIFLSQVVCVINIKAQQHKTNKTLETKQQYIVTISAFTAKGDLPSLQKCINGGLDAGLTINEIKEVMIQLYAYAGFPRSLNALNTFMAVLKERKQKGINDEMGMLPSPLPTNKSRLQFGTETQTKLLGSPIKGEVYEFAPTIDQFLKEHLFGDIFGRDNLDFKTRELATISALASLGGTENQLRSHYGVGMYNGLTETELNDFVTIIKSEVGNKYGDSAQAVLQRVLKQRKGDDTKAAEIPEYKTKVYENSKNEVVPNAVTIFPKGKKIINSNFTGATFLEPLVQGDSSNPIQVGNVTFEAGARTKWHSHTSGQILLAIGGTGYYQEKGQPKRILHVGDVVKCPPNVPHWHGASIDDQFIQVAITNPEKGTTVWLEPVTDAQYNSVVK